MWQLLLAAAAAAGSGILARKLINPDDPNKAILHLDQNPQGRDENQSLKSPDSTLPFEEENSCSQGNIEEDDGRIFRFCSSQTGPKDSKKKSRSVVKKNSANRGKKPGLGDDQKRERKITVCLKKRRTGKAASEKCKSCASKDDSFGWGVGLGIVYMASAGKAEIGRLNSAMEETGKVVQELKAEILRRKSLCNDHATNVVSIPENETNIHAGSHNRHLCAEPGMYKTTPFRSSLTEHECGSSGITEEQQPDTLEIALLEPELETELQKLPWCTAEGLDSDRPARSLEQCNGVLADELDKKLCQVLIEQQCDQIAELEAELQRARSKLYKKEVELESLKNCVKRLGEFSLANPSDEECVHKEDDGETTVGIEGKPFESMVGMKRATGCDPPDCSSE